MTFLRARSPRHWSRSTRASLIAAAIAARTLHALGESASLSCCRPCTLHRTPTSQEAPISSCERPPVSRGSSPPSSFPSSCVSRPATPTIAQWPFTTCTICSCLLSPRGRGWAGLDCVRILPSQVRFLLPVGTAIVEISVFAP